MISCYNIHNKPAMPIIEKDDDSEHDLKIKIIPSGMFFVKWLNIFITISRIGRLEYMKLIF